MNPIFGRRFSRAGLALLFVLLVQNCDKQDEDKTDAASSNQAKLAELTGRAEAGDVDAQIEIAHIYEDITSLPLNDSIAAFWYHKAADQDNHEAWFKLALMYKEGRGVPPDMTRAEMWLKKAGKVYYPDACAEIGVGALEYPGMEPLAAMMFRKGAEQGHARCATMLAAMLDEGNGIEKDPVEATEWYKFAAEKGIAIAQNNLGTHYGDGIGTEKDIEKAYKWWRIAFAGGQEDSERAYQSAISFLTASQIDAVESEIEQYNDKIDPDEAGAVPVSVESVIEGPIKALVEVAGYYVVSDSGQIAFPPHLIVGHGSRIDMNVNGTWVKLASTSDIVFDGITRNGEKVVYDLGIAGYRAYGRRLGDLMIVYRLERQ